MIDLQAELDAKVSEARKGLAVAAFNLATLRQRYVETVAMEPKRSDFLSRGLYRQAHRLWHDGCEAMAASIQTNAMMYDTMSAMLESIERDPGEAMTMQ